MWVAKIKIQGENMLLGSSAKKCSVALSGYPVHAYEKENHIEVDIVGFVIGTDKEEDDFIKDLRSQENVLHVEKEGNFVLCRIVEPKQYSFVYHYGLIHLEPVIINEEGIQYWTLGSWKKENILGFVGAVENVPGAEIVSVEQKKIKNFAFLNVKPDLSSKQREAMNLAIKRGYYDYPRKIDLDGLSKISGVSYSTFQAHLRKAENKFLPFCFRNFYEKD